MNTTKTITLTPAFTLALISGAYAFPTTTSGTEKVLQQDHNICQLFDLCGAVLLSWSSRNETLRP